MGRYYFDSKTTLESCSGITTQFLKKYRHLTPDTWSRGSCSWSVNGRPSGEISFIVDTKELFIQFIYTQTDRRSGEKTQKDYRVRLATTACNFGGSRYWFLCTYCGRKVCGLYLEGKNDFACRHCLKLTYNTRNSTKRFRDYQKFFDLEKAHERISHLKRRYYRGKPTRRYGSLIRKVERLSNFDIGSLVSGDLL